MEKGMKPAIKIFFYLILLTMSLTGTAFAGADMLGIANETKATIAAICLSRTGTGEWSENLIPSDFLKHGETAALPFNRGCIDRYWDIKIIDVGLRETIFEKLPLPDIYEIEIFPDGQIKYEEIKRTT